MKLEHLKPDESGLYEPLKLTEDRLATALELHIVRNPARPGWTPVIRFDHYHVGPQAILQGEEEK